jgi:hypothetical protein
VLQSAYESVGCILFIQPIVPNRVLHREGMEDYKKIVYNATNRDVIFQVMLSKGSASSAM